MKEAYIFDGIRTAIGKLGGGLSATRADDLAAIPLKELLKRNPTVDPKAIDDVILGCHNQAGEDNRNVARMALLLAGIPYSVPGETVNRLCSSGMSALVHAGRAIKSGDADLVLAGGMEHMTRGPLVLSKSETAFTGQQKIYDSSFGWRFVNPKMQEKYGIDSMGVTAENLAEMYKISREDQDAFAYHSQMKAYEAEAEGYFAGEIIAVNHTDKKGNTSVFDRDEFIKPNTTIEALSKLKPAFKKEGGTVTAGNSSGLNDGAAAVLIGSELAAKNFNLIPRGRIISSAVVGVEPRIMGIGPVEASQKALSKANLSLDDMDIIELNEAFSAQSLAVIRALGLQDHDSRINPHGGAIALGHPLGMSGTRISYTALRALEKTNKRYALATMCIGVGMGYALVIERI